MSKRWAGFTIIEVMLVLAVAGLIAVLVLLAIPQVNRSQRDSQRKKDLRSIQVALEEYFTRNLKYPTAGLSSAGAGSDRGCWKNNTNNPNEGYAGCHPLAELKTQGLLDVIPIDPGKNTYNCPPSNPTNCGCGGAQFYSYWSNGKQYLLGAVSESTGYTGCTETGFWGGKTGTAYTYQYYVKNYTN